MTALVERGAPTDIWDIHAVCRTGLTDSEQCRALWEKRQGLAASDADRQRARLAIESHLARTSQHRPLSGISGAAQSAEAEEVRRWFTEAMLRP